MRSLKKYGPYYFLCLVFGAFIGWCAIQIGGAAARKGPEVVIVCIICTYYYVVPYRHLPIVNAPLGLIAGMVGELACRYWIL